MRLVTPQLVGHCVGGPRLLLDRLRCERRRHGSRLVRSFTVAGAKQQERGQPSNVRFAVDDENDDGCGCGGGYGDAAQGFP